MSGEMSGPAVHFTVDDMPVCVMAPPDRRLIALLRDDLGITGPKEGCAIGRCGACVVLLDGRPVNACLVLAARLEGRTVTTVAGLGERARPVQEALAEAGAVQCGYCAPGLVVALTALLERPDPPVDGAEVSRALSGQICRCTGYGGLRRALAALGLPVPA